MHFLQGNVFDFDEIKIAKYMYVKAKCGQL